MTGYVHEPNREWYRKRSGEGPVQIELPSGETFVVEVRGGE